MASYVQLYIRSACLHTSCVQSCRIHSVTERIFHVFAANQWILPYIEMRAQSILSALAVVTSTGLYCTRVHGHTLAGPRRHAEIGDPQAVGALRKRTCCLLQLAATLYILRSGIHPMPGCMSPRVRLLTLKATEKRGPFDVI